MPTYEYRCKTCGHELEAVQSFTDDPLTECPDCGGDLRKKFSAVGISFKGSGFYKTDSRSSSGAKAGANGTSSSSGSDGTSSSGSSDGSSSSADASSSSDSSSDGSSTKTASTPSSGSSSTTGGSSGSDGGGSRPVPSPGATPTKS